MTQSDRISPDDLRRATRLIVALKEGDPTVQKMVCGEVHRLGRWHDMALATAVVARIVLLQIDEDDQDEGAIALWLHNRVESLIDSGD